MSGKIAPGASAERTVSFSLTLDAVRTQMSAVTKGQLVWRLWCGTKSYWCSEPVEALVDSRCGKKKEPWCMRDIFWSGAAAPSLMGT